MARLTTKTNGVGVARSERSTRPARDIAAGGGATERGRPAAGSTAGCGPLVTSVTGGAGSSRITRSGEAVGGHGQRLAHQRPQVAARRRGTVDVQLAEQAEAEELDADDDQQHR